MSKTKSGKETTVAPIPELGIAAESFAKLESDIAALASSDVGRITTDVPTAVSIALGSIPPLTALLPEMKRLLVQAPEAELNRLRDRALALLHAHTQWIPRSPAGLEEDLEEARKLRERLLAAADAHVAHGHLSAGAVAAVRDGAGYLDRAQDLIALGHLFRASWDVIGGRTMVTMAELERASTLGVQLMGQLGEKALQTGSASGQRQWTDIRNRAFRLFMNDYDELRRATEYVRYHEDDADDFAPSLHPRSRRSNGGNGNRSAEPTTPEVDGEGPEVIDA